MKPSYGWKLLPYLRPYRLRFLWALAQVFLIAAFELLKPWPLQVVIDDVLGGMEFHVNSALSRVPAVTHFARVCTALRGVRRFDFLFALSWICAVMSTRRPAHRGRSS
jgi:ABC-type multidrug transport system fused ATPase/permease subunit